MAKYKVLEEFVLNGIVQKLDSIIELDNMKASLKSIQKNIEKVADNVQTSVGGSVLGSIKEGEQLTPEQKEKLAKENLAETVEAQRLAAERRTQDQQEGKNEPPVKVIADILKGKLEREEFETKKPGVLPPETDPNNLS